jgi:lipopolysaccharide heptosyltransferase I
VEPANFEKILIVRLGALGDVVHVLPALKALRRACPGARIHWAVETACASLLQGHPDLEAVHVIPRKEWSRSLRNPASWASVLKGAEGVFKTLRRAGFDLAVDFQGNLRSAVVTALSGAPVRLGFGRGANKENSQIFYTIRVVPENGGLHKVEKNLALLEALGIDTAQAGPPALQGAPLSAEARDAVAALPRPRLAIHPGVSRFGALKAYPPARFARVARDFIARTGGSVLVSFGPGEEEEAESVAREAGPGTRPAPACGSLAALITLYRSADVFCGVDTGPTQLAGAAGLPVVALFGPKDPRIYRPRGEAVRVLSAPPESLDCIPCNGRRCPKADAGGFSPCMTALEPDAVLEAILDALPKKSET